MQTDGLVTLKEQLWQLCHDAQTKRITYARQAMEEAQQAANGEERSTAGDKYDTSRAMSQNVRDMNARQLQEAQRELALLQQINPKLLCTEVKSGCVVKTSMGNYFIALSGGTYQLGKETYICVSPSSPVAQLMLTKQKGSIFQFRGKQITIEEVF